MSTPLDPIPTRPYAIVMLLTGGLALGLGVFISQALGGEGTTLLAVGGALLACVLLSVIPMLGRPLVTPDNWGIVVLGVSLGRTLLALGAMAIYVEMSGLPRRPVVIPLLTCTLVLMVAEAVTAVWLLSRRDRLRSITPDHRISMEGTTH
jgi:hypothetical protein